MKKMSNSVNEFATEEDAIDAASEIREVSTTGWPSGYTYGATRYADVILKESFPERFEELILSLERFHPTLDELRSGGGGRTVFVRRFDESLGNMYNGTVWGKQNISIKKTVSLDGTIIRKSKVRGHEIDMFGKGSFESPIPGIAVEMEWNNKDPFYDRDLINFQALHQEGAISMGVIVTRGPRLQELISQTIRSKDGGWKYGQSSTHWEKLTPRVNLGGGGECPLLLIGIEPERIEGIELAQRVAALLEEAASFRSSWRDQYSRWADAKPTYDQKCTAALELMPPVKTESSEVGDD